MAVLLTVTSAAFALLEGAEDRWAVEPEAADVQQRLRVAATMLHHDLLQAGAGPVAGVQPGPLTAHIAAIRPYKDDPRDGDAPGTFRADAITTFYVPGTTAQSTLAAALPARAGWARVSHDPGCPPADPACAFSVGMAVMVFDGTGASDRFTVTEVQGDLLGLVHDGPDSNHVYGAGSSIAEIVARTSFPRNRAGIGHDPADAGSGQWRCGCARGGPHRVAGLRVRSGVGTRRRTGPAAARHAGRRSLAPGCGEPEPLRCRPARNQKRRIRLRVQSAVRALRGPAGALFGEAGTSRSARRWLPDFEVRFRVRPRNLNPGT